MLMGLPGNFQPRFTKNCTEKKFCDDLTPDSLFCVTPKWYIKLRVFYQYLRHFDAYFTADNSLLMLYGHKKYVENAVLLIWEEPVIKILCLRAQHSNAL